MVLLQAEALGDRDSQLACRAVQLQKQEAALHHEESRLQQLLQELDNRVLAVESQERDVARRMAAAVQEEQDMQQRKLGLGAQEQHLADRLEDVQVSWCLPQPSSAGHMNRQESLNPKPLDRQEGLKVKPCNNYMPKYTCRHCC